MPFPRLIILLIILIHSIFCAPILFNSSDIQALAQQSSRGVYEACILEMIENADEQRTVAEVKQSCSHLIEELESKSNGDTDSKDVRADLGETPLKKRKVLESIAQDLPFLLVPHKRNYVLPVAYNFSPNSKPLRDESIELDNAEVKFQFSLKARMLEEVYDGVGEVWFAYTNLSFWQAYNGANSSFFRETNHEPEVFIDFEPKLEFEGWSNSLLRIGAVHQSNGRGGLNSRSWNRVYALAVLEKQNWYFGFKPWYRIPESEKDSPDDPRGDDNPDIDKFLGYGEVHVYYRGENHRIGAMYRNNLRSENRSAFRLDWSYPISENIRAYLQYFNGYGESLIDYNDSSNRLGLGLLFSETL